MQDSKLPAHIQTNLLIDGKFVASSSGQTFTTINPADEQVLATIQEASLEDVDRAVAAAKKAFEDGPWRKMTGRERGVLIYKLADLIEKNINELATLEALDNGKTFDVARNVDMIAVIKQFRYDAGWADKVNGAVIPLDGPYL
jgi:aldehyde dehydrogenase (NAD+)